MKKTTLLLLLLLAICTGLVLRNIKKRSIKTLEKSEKLITQINTVAKGASNMLDYIKADYKAKSETLPKLIRRGGAKINQGILITISLVAFFVVCQMFTLLIVAVSNPSRT